MNKTVKANVLRVFVNPKGQFGNPVGIVLDEEKEINLENRQKIAAKLGFSESVFIDNSDTGKISIFNPTKEVKFAGHAIIGATYFVNQILHKPINTLECKGGKVRFWMENGLLWINANLEETPPWHHKQLKDQSEVENLTLSQTKNLEHTMVWAWIDEVEGVVIARTFAPDWGIPEDQGNGSGSMQLAVLLKKRLEIHHGKGSVIYAQPAENNGADVGGRVVEDQSREIELN